MKNYLYLLAGLLAMQYIPAAQSQNISANDSVTTGARYANDVWYSLKNGSVKTAPATNWHIAFSVTPVRSATVRINEVSGGVTLFRTSKPLTDFATLDTTGAGANVLHNSDTTWTYGAFNASRNLSNPFDEGWGVYDQVTRTVIGDEVYLLRITTGAPGQTKNTFYKIAILEQDPNMNAQTYKFRYATLDNTFDTTITVDRKLYPNRRFVYYDMNAKQLLDREPNFNDWDLLFTRYYETLPGDNLMYPVAGILQNNVFTFTTNEPNGVRVAEVRDKPASINAQAPNLSEFNRHINTIGSDWKTFSQANNQWTIKDSLVYFVSDRNNVIWRLIMTGFTGSVSGKYLFNKSEVVTTSRILKDNLTGSENTLSLYPNPANEITTLVLKTALDNRVITLQDLTGRVVYRAKHSGGVITVPTAELTPGLYVVNIEGFSTRLKLQVGH